MFEERVIADHGEWIYLYRHPAVAEEELAKLKKTKPKTLANVNDLNPVCMRAWVDLGNLDSQTVTHITVRCRLTQVDKNGETS